jgi:hypothetical protein
MQEEWQGRLAIEGISRFASKRNSEKEYFVVLVRPSGVTISDRLISTIREAGFDVGWDAVTEQVPLFDTGGVR